jgi:hypothetical protein
VSDLGCAIYWNEKPILLGYNQIWQGQQVGATNIAKDPESTYIGVASVEADNMFEIYLDKTMGEIGEVAAGLIKQSFEVYLTYLKALSEERESKG